MISRHEVYLNGVALSSVNPDILILDVQYQPATFQTETFATAKRQGARILRRYADKTLVTVNFAIRKYSTRERQSAYSDVVNWAKNGGVLQTSDRDGQILRCVCEAFPSLQSVSRWTDTLSIVFAAYALPYWEEQNPVTLRLSGSSGENSMYVPGNVDGAMVEATITANASLSSISLTVNERQLSLSGLSVTANQVISISYDDEMIQSIKVGTTSLLNKRTGVDDLMANCGDTNTFGFTSNSSVDVDFIVRGLWL